MTSWLDAQCCLFRCPFTGFSIIFWRRIITVPFAGFWAFVAGAGTGTPCSPFTPITLNFNYIEKEHDDCIIALMRVFLYAIIFTAKPHFIAKYSLYPKRGLLVKTIALGKTRISAIDRNVRFLSRENYIGHGGDCIRKPSKLSSISECATERFL